VSVSSAEQNPFSLSHVHTKDNAERHLSACGYVRCGRAPRTLRCGILQLDYLRGAFAILPPLRTCAHGHLRKNMSTACAGREERARGLHSRAV
jgi:hypothetical protein